MKHCDVVIIGGGIIGSSIAYSLAKRGKKVAILEKDTIAAHASGAAGGMLGAQVEFPVHGPLVEISIASRKMFDELQPELHTLTGIDFQLRKAGMLRIAFSEEEKSLLTSQAAWQSRLGLSAEWLEPAEVTAMEPAVSVEIAGALSLKDDTQVSAPDLSMAFAVAAARYGAEIVEQCEVTSIQHTGNRITGVETWHGIFEADEYIIAGGAWSGKIAELLSLSLPIFPIKGEAFSAFTLPHPVQRTIYSHGCYIVPKNNHRLLVGASVKNSGFDARLTVGGMQELMAKAVRLLPALKDCPLDKTWASLRPQTEDGLPYVGRLSSFENGIIAAGHYRNGILLSPITGHLVAQIVSGETPDFPIEAFSDRRRLSSPV
ncbi:glycine oxidase ThiO [Aneurinibacillus terranovensis]|uniref:glycine oxidase ThiO n=1 Tax=Aneurinibacillus terranovensis TaxID=278991 RepID=UPI0003FEB244|nr:glycine oxidase ThiO [Aneurinibacillus terranovensis]